MFKHTRTEGMGEAMHRWSPIVRSAHIGVLINAAAHAEPLGSHCTDHLAEGWLAQVAIDYRDDLLRREGDPDFSLPRDEYGLRLAILRYQQDWWVMRATHDAGTCAYCDWCLYQHFLSSALDQILEV